MTTQNHTEINVHNQLMNLKRCIDSLKDVSDNIPVGEAYGSVLSVIHTQLNTEYVSLLMLTSPDIEV
ncbi:hypothetical protein [Thalassotalea ganghwensis]